MIVRIPQQSNECLPCCIAMVLDQTRETVLSWFEGRDYESILVMIEVLAMKGYAVDEVEAVGFAGGTRRILALTNGTDGGHAVVMDEDESIVDPQSKATTKKYFLDYAGSGYSVKHVFVISKKED